ncbi:MAG: superoxide dismutase family protein [Acidobacteria bacterium]|nr:MAG: superoxide dismutase family protein [Acidobacteriota bacterium]
MRRLALAGICVFCAFALSCSESEPNATSTEAVGETQTPQAGGQVTMAVAELQPAAGKNVKGTVTFESVGGNEVKVTAHITGLAPGKHGFHVHEKGDCSAPDFTSAGGHFNPTNAPHGAPSDTAHHSGDLGNIEVNSSGVGHLETTVDFLELNGPNSIVGKGLIVHSKEDDLKTQPTGDAGGREACAVIKAK